MDDGRVRPAGGFGSAGAVFCASVAESGAPMVRKEATEARDHDAPTAVSGRLTPPVGARKALRQ